MNFLTTYFSASSEQLIGLVAVLIVGLGFSVVGAAIGGRNRYAPADLLVGWGATALVFTLIGTSTAIAFSWVAAVMAVVAVACGGYVWWRDRRLVPDGTVKIVLMIATLFLLVTAMGPSQWDEYSHWLAAARYLFEIDVFPGIGLPVPLADYPGYPTGQSLIPYLVSKLSNRFVENASPLFHIVVLISLALAAMDVIRRGAGLDQKAKASWGFCALGFMTVTIFSTAFVQKIIFTAYADFPVSAATAFAGLLGWMILGALEDEEEAKSRTLALQLGFVLIILLNLKPSSLVLEVGVLGGVLIASVRDPNLRLSQFLRLLPQIVIPGVVIYAAWNSYVATHLLREFGSHTVLPFEKWQWEHMSTTLPTMLSIMTKKGFYFGMMFILSGFSLLALFRYKSKFDRFTLIVGCTFVGYNLFLAFAYLAIFTGFTSLHALSYWRYNMHIAHLGVFCAAYGLSVLWQSRSGHKLKAIMPHLAKAGIAILVLLPLVFAHKIRFDVRAPKQFVNEVGAEMRTMLLKEARVFVFDPLSNGFYGKQLSYLLYDGAILTGSVSHFWKPTPKMVLDALNKSRSTHVWIHTQTKKLQGIFGLDLPERHAHLLEQQGVGWKLIKSWPYPGYNVPQDIPD